MAGESRLRSGGEGAADRPEDLLAQFGHVDPAAGLNAGADIFLEKLEHPLHGFRDDRGVLGILYQGSASMADQPAYSQDFAREETPPSMVRMVPVV